MRMEMGICMRRFFVCFHGKIDSTINQWKDTQKEKESQVICVNKKYISMEKYYVQS